MAVNVTGLDKLQRELQDAQRAFRSLDRTVATLKFDPADRSSVDAAIRSMERAIDAKTGQRRGNRLVQTVASGVKEKFRGAILERAARERSRRRV